MDVERVVRGVLARLDGIDEELRDEVRDALREALVQERRRSLAGLTVESERERRVEAEALRAGLEGIVHQAHLSDTCHEVLRQLGRIVVLDSCSLALLQADGELRIVAAEGFPDGSRIIGTRYRDRLSEMILESHREVAVADAGSDDRYAPLAAGSRVRAWAGVPLTVEGELIGILSLDRHTASPFDDEEIHRAKALAFSAAAAIRNARLLESVERYSAVLEQVVALYETATRGDAARAGHQLVEGAVRFGYLAGLWVHEGRVAAVSGAAFEPALARDAPSGLDSRKPEQLGGELARGVGEKLGLQLGDGSLRLIPLARDDDESLGTLVLLDAGPEGADSTIEAYAARAAAALAHALRG